MAAILFGSKFVLSFFVSSGNYWGDIPEYRHVYSAIEGIQCTIYIQIYMVFVSCIIEYIWFSNHIYSEIAHIRYYMILVPCKFEYVHVNSNIKIFDITWAAKIGFPSIFEFSCTRSTQVTWSNSRIDCVIIKISCY